MAVPAYATDLTDISTDFSTNWNLVSEGGGGANSLTAPEVDDFIQGTNGVSRNPWSSNIRGVAYDRALITVATDDAVFHWWKADVAQALDTFAAGGIQIIHGSTLTDYKRYFVAGKDTYALGGWRCTPIDPTSTTSGTARGTPGSPDYDIFGVIFDLPSTGPSKGFPFKADMIRHGRSVDVTAGEIANPATWDLLTAHADATARRWGVVQGTDTGAAVQGIVNWGTAAALCYSRDNNRSIVLTDTLGFVTTSFTQIVFANASTDVVWDAMTILSLDSLNKGIITVLNNAAVTFTNGVISNLGVTTDGGTNSVWDGTTWASCDEVAAAGGSFLGCSVLTSSAAANTSAFEYNETANPDGILDGMTFTQGAAAHHAIEFGLTSPTAITLNDMSFTDFDADTTNGAALHFLRTSGTVTVTLDGTTTPTYKTAGATIEFVVGAVTVDATTLTAAGVAVGSCRVFLYATATTGSLPANVTVTIANSGTTATVTHTAHGLKTNDKVDIKGASLTANLGTYQITVTGVNTYTYTMASTPGSSPTGTIKATFVFLAGVTNATTGLISMTRSIPADQSVQGWARKSSAADSPKYSQGPLAGTVSSTTGASFAAVMIENE